MNIHFFFEGKLSREEATSALLATLLEQRADFRAFFFDQCGIPESDRKSGDRWSIVTEKHEFDILMECASSDWAILIENKIKSGSVMPEQLNRYYRRLRTASDKRILLVYLTPKPGTGQTEFGRLSGDKESGTDDRFVHLSWPDIFAYESQMVTGDEDLELVGSGFAATKNHIESSLQETYPLVGGRERVDEIACRIHSDLSKEFPHIQFRRWRGADASTVYTAKCKISVYFKGIMDYDENSYEPVNLLNDDGTLNVTLEVNMGISESGRKKPEIVRKWQAMSEGGTIGIPGLGNMTTRSGDGKWFFWNSEITASDNEIHAELLEACRSVLKRLKEFF